MIAAKTSQLTNKIENGEPVSFAFHYPTNVTIKFLNSLMTKVLSRDEKVFLQNTIITILKEMIINAVKANTKRIFFKEHHLNINDENDYEEGMTAFKEFLVESREYSEEVLKENDLKVLFGLRKLENGIKVIVQNNSPLLPDEYRKIKSRIELAKQYDNFSQVYQDVADDEEGEGLGILLTMLFLRNSGIGEDSFRIATEGKITQSSFVIPMALKPKEITSELLQHLIDEVDQLPSFPEQVNELIVMCKDPDADINLIAKKIMLDPSLTASVLKLANSAGFITGKKIEHVDEAIMVIGLKNLNTILIAASAQKIMEDRYSSFKKIWGHSKKTAVLSRLIAVELKRKQLMEQSFIAGLLHDLGKIVLLSTNSSLSEWISEIVVKRKERTSTVIEEVAIGISHSSIGALIANKWNLPDFLTETICFHHAPLSATVNQKDIVYLTYLGNMLTGIEEKRYDYSAVEGDVLDHFNIKGEQKLKLLHEVCITKRNEMET